jgi:hypothetical protein
MKLMIGLGQDRARFDLLGSKLRDNQLIEKWFPLQKLITKGDNCSSHVGNYKKGRAILLGLSSIWV